MKNILAIILTMAAFLFIFSENTIGATFVDNFNDGDFSGWTPKIGSWSVNSDMHLVNSGTPYGVIWKDESFGIYQKLQVDAFFNLSAGQNERIAHLRLRNNKHDGATQPYWDNGYLADFQPNRIRIFNTYMNGNPEIASFVFSNSPFTSTGWYELAFSVSGTGSETHFNTWVNGIMYIDQDYNNTIPDLDAGYIGLGRKIQYDNAQGYSYMAAVPIPSTLLLLSIGLAGLLSMKKYLLNRSIN